MLTKQELKNLLTTMESDRVERTQSTKDKDKFAEAICAFSNDIPNHQQPGYLLIGVDDRGHPTGLQVTDELLQQLASIRSDGNVQPLPVMTVQKYELPDGEIAVVEVLPSDMPPVRYKGRVYIRVGPTRRIANESDERILSERRTIRLKSFDVAPCMDSTLDDLSLDLFTINYLPNAVSSETRVENHRSVKEQLASLRFYDLNKDCPTNAGILLFGLDPLYWIPGAYIQFLRFQGSKTTDNIQAEEKFTGDLLTVLRKLQDYIPMQIQKHTEFDDSFQSRRVYDYPNFAVREFLMNAVIHRTYGISMKEGSTTPIRVNWFSDRIEIISPGGLYPEATPDNFPRVNAYRNPALAEAVKVLGYVEKFSLGVIRAQEELKKNGNPEAQFRFEPTYVLVTIRKEP
jgi:ATP-dependent DNA helicase RecG